ncbi:MAG TPA: glycosyltransferase 87 family protein [Frankiaceae bacterium]|nr:glycosyltransferase 87 family protein [Frankiaceae bacterium]
MHTTTDEVSAPSRTDRFVRDASTLVGGPVGKHTRFGAAYFWNPVRVLVVLSMLTFTLGWLAKTPCSGHSWEDNYQYTRMCYSDVYALYFSEGLNEDKVPYVDHPVEYPVVIGGVMWAAGHVGDDATDFFNVTSALLLVCAVGTVICTALAAGKRRPWDAALVALAPGLLLHGTTNWDLISAFLLALAMWSWSRRQPGLAGIWIGLGIATKLYPGILLGALLFLCWRARRMRDWAVATAVALGTAVLVYLPVTGLRIGPLQVLEGGAHRFPYTDCETGREILQPAWQRFFALNRCRPADWDSFAFMYQRWTGNFLDHSKLNLITAVGVVTVVLLVGIVTLSAPRRPRVAQVTFLLLAGFLLVNKVNSPQYTIWLIPLAALARPRWGAFLAWQFSELLVVFTRFYYFIWEGTKGADGIQDRWFIGAVLLRNGLLMLLMALVVREIYRPYHDVVRRDGEDDPAGGVLDGALDRDETAGAWRAREPDEWTPPPATPGAPASPAPA